MTFMLVGQGIGLSAASVASPYYVCRVVCARVPFVIKI